MPDFGQPDTEATPQPVSVAQVASLVFQAPPPAPALATAMPDVEPASPAPSPARSGPRAAHRPAASAHPLTAGAVGPHANRRRSRATHGPARRREKSSLDVLEDPLHGLQPGLHLGEALADLGELALGTPSSLRR